jgi:hypothetical protein
MCATEGGRCQYSPSHFNAHSLGIGQSVQSKLKMAILTVISYHDVAYTFDAAFLTSLFENVKVCLLAHAIII